MKPSRALAGSLIAALGAHARASHAQDGTDVARRTLIEMATQASQQGEHGRAIELASRAAQLRNTASLRFFVAREHLRIAQHVQALAVAGDCVALANADRTAPDRDAMIARCTAVIDEASRSVGRLVVRVEDNPPADLQVTVDGVALVGALFNIAVPHEPRSIEVRATARDRATFARSVALEAGATAEITVELAPLPRSVPLVTITPVEPPARRVLVAPDRDRSAAPSAGPWTLAGVSVAGFAAGGIAGGIAVAARSDRDAACPSATDCDLATALRSDDRYRTSATIANVSLVTAGAFAAGALTWWLVERFARRPASTRVSIAPVAVTVRW